MAALSSIPVPLTNEIPLSNWAKEHCPNEYRPTPPIDEDLMSNTRVIHGITSVPNRNGMKRNQLVDEYYKSYLDKLQERSKQTSFIVDVDLAAGDQNNNENNETLISAVDGNGDNNNIIIVEVEKFSEEVESENLNEVET
jgi:hypothetical protein